MTQVLVTGATTPLGRRIVERLADDPAIAHVLALGPEPPEFHSERVTGLEVDLTHSRSIRDLMLGPAVERGVDAIIHTAFHRRASDSGRRIRKLNVDATRLLLELAEETEGVERFVMQSSAAIYRVSATSPAVIGEDQALDMSVDAPDWVRHRVEADLTVCARMGLSSVRFAVLRCAEILAPDSGSQIYDYLKSRVCFRPMGFDPMINLLSVDDAARAFQLALKKSTAEGVFNIPGADSLPLSLLIEKWGRRDVAVPGPLLSPLYRWRRALRGTDFRYDLNRRRFHFNAVLDGARARRELDYTPQAPIRWPAGPSGPREESRK